MRGGRRSLAALGVLFVVLACSGDRGSGAVPATGGESSDTAGAASADTAAISSPDTAAPAAARDTAAPAPQPATGVAQQPPARKPAPAPKPAAAKPVPDPTPPVAEPAPDTTPAPAAPAAEASAPLRDQYHQAPRDTVSQEVYDGWKQYNLNCARCHGEDVLGTTIAAHLIVSVRPGGAAASKEAFIQTVCAGRPEKGMPAWCPLGLEMDKINAIYEYVKGRSEGKIAPGRPALRQ